MATPAGLANIGKMYETSETSMPAIAQNANTQGSGPSTTQQAAALNGEVSTNQDTNGASGLPMQEQKEKKAEMSVTDFYKSDADSQSGTVKDVDPQTGKKEIKGKQGLTPEEAKVQQWEGDIHALNQSMGELWQHMDGMQIQSQLEKKGYINEMELQRSEMAKLRETITDLLATIHLHSQLAATVQSNLGGISTMGAPPGAVTTSAPPTAGVNPVVSLAPGAVSSGGSVHIKTGTSEAGHDRFKEGLVRDAVKTITKYTGVTDVYPWVKAMRNALKKAELSQALALWLIRDKLDSIAFDWWDREGKEVMDWQEALNMIEKRFKNKHLVEQARLEFISGGQRPTENLEEYYVRMSEGFPRYWPNTPDPDRASIFCNGVRSGTLRAALKGLEIKPKTLEDAYSMALNKYHSLLAMTEGTPIKEVRETRTVPKAIKAVSFVEEEPTQEEESTPILAITQQRGPTRPSTPSPVQRNSERTGACFNCGELGHHSRDCPKAEPCGYCGMKGHKQERCRMYLRAQERIAEHKKKAAQGTS